MIKDRNYRIFSRSIYSYFQKNKVEDNAEDFIEQIFSILIEDRLNNHQKAVEKAWGKQFCTKAQDLVRETPGLVQPIREDYFDTKPNSINDAFWLLRCLQRICIYMDENNAMVEKLRNKLFCSYKYYDEHYYFNRSSKNENNTNLISLKRNFLQNKHFFNLEELTLENLQIEMRKYDWISRRTEGPATVIGVPSDRNHFIDGLELLMDPDGILHIRNVIPVASTQSKIDKEGGIHQIYIQDGFFDFKNYHQYGRPRWHCLGMQPFMPTWRNEIIFDADYNEEYGMEINRDGEIMWH